MDMNKLMQQAQQMQAAMQKAQEELSEKNVEADSGGGAVKVVCNGKLEIVSVTIDPKVVDADEADLLEDLVLTAVQQAQKRAADMAQKEMAKVAGPMAGMGGLF